MSDKAPLPFLWGVLYAPPNADGSQKRCENCCLYVEKHQACLIHSKDLVIAPAAVCGYHVYGYPVTDDRIDLRTDGIDPELSGLIDVSALGGTSCGSCRYYEPKESGHGLCHGVAKKSRKPPVPVQELGCCGRWEKAE